MAKQSWHDLRVSFARFWNATNTIVLNDQNKGDLDSLHFEQLTNDLINKLYTCEENHVEVEDKMKQLEAREGNHVEVEGNMKQLEGKMKQLEANPKELEEKVKELEAEAQRLRKAKVEESIRKAQKLRKAEVEESTREANIEAGPTEKDPDTDEDVVLIGVRHKTTIVDTFDYGSVLELFEHTEFESQ